MKGFVSFLTGAVMGALVGATLATLFAPSSGQDLRRQVQERTVHIQSEVKQAAAARRAELEQQLAAMRAPRKAGEA